MEVQHARDPVKNRANTARTRQRLKSYKEWKAHLLAQWSEHNTFHITEQSDGGFRVRLEHSAEGDRITAEISKLCGLDPHTVVQRFVGEAIVEMGGKWIPNKRES